MFANETKSFSNPGLQPHFPTKQFGSHSVDSATGLISKTCPNQEFDHHSYERGIEIRAAAVINRHPQLAPLSQDISFYFTDGCLMMAGEVPSFYIKQVIQEVVRKLEEVERVENRIEVCNLARV